ncbi:uncharacterized protein LOC106082305 [Stomoxys calcitrans]|uniref:uncharacterized protein LOC106082305 n=1 Tax=Stomoxys calcitrans TaxID=35570 RepID=UPI0027E37815|nr:uncharacterized protein LOC106082305 [Stomoxys calcitrans]
MDTNGGTATVPSIAAAVAVTNHRASSSNVIAIGNQSSNNNSSNPSDPHSTHHSTHHSTLIHGTAHSTLIHNNSSSSSTSSSGYDSTSATPTSSSSSSSAYETHTAATTPVILAETTPHIPTVTVAAVSPFYSEAINSQALAESQHYSAAAQHQASNLHSHLPHHNQQQLSTIQPFQQQHSQKQHQQQQQQQQYYSNTYDYAASQQEQQQLLYQQTPLQDHQQPLNHSYLEPSGSFDASNTASGINTIGATSAGSYQHQTMGSHPYKSTGITAALNYERHMGGRSTSARSGAPSYHEVASASKSSSHSQHGQQYLGHSNLPSSSSSSSSSKSRSASSSLLGSSLMATSSSASSKPQAAATPFYAQPLSQPPQTSNATTFYDQIKHKIPLDYHENYGSYPNTAAYQQKYYAAAKSQLKEAAYGSPQTAAALAGKSLYHNSNSYFAAGASAQHASAASGLPPSAGFDKYMYAGGYPSLGYESNPAETIYRKSSASSLSSSSWPWGLDYASGNSRSIPPPPPTAAASTGHLPTATVAPTHATYLGPNTTHLARDPYYMSHDKYGVKYDKYTSAYPQTGAYASPPAARHHLWAPTHNPLNERLPAAPLAPPPHGAHAMHTAAPYYPPTNAGPPASINARQSCCTQPYPPQNCFYPPPPSGRITHGQPVPSMMGASSSYIGSQSAPTHHHQPHLSALSSSCKYGNSGLDYAPASKLKTPNDLYISSHYETSNLPPPHHLAHSHHASNYPYPSGPSNQLYNANQMGGGHGHQPAGPLIAHDGLGNSTTYTNDLSLPSTANTYDAYLHEPPPVSSHVNAQAMSMPAHASNYAAASANKRALLDYRKPMQQPTVQGIQSSDNSYNHQAAGSVRSSGGGGGHFGHSTELQNPSETTSNTYNDYDSQASGYADEENVAASLHHGKSTEEGTNKNLSLRDFIANWNDDEEDYGASNEVMGFEQESTPINPIAQSSSAESPANMEPTPPPLMEEKPMVKIKEEISKKLATPSVPVHNEVDGNQYVNLPDIIIDIEKSNVNSSIITPPIGETLAELNPLSLDNFDVEKELDQLQQMKKTELDSVIVKPHDLEEKATESRSPESSLNQAAKNLTTQLSFEDLNLDSATKTVLAPKPHNSTDVEGGYDSGSSRHSNESSLFEKEYETFIHKISSSNEPLTKAEEEIEQKVQDFSKFYKRKRKLRDEEVKTSSSSSSNSTSTEQSSKKLRSGEAEEVNDSNFPRVYTKKSRNRLHRKIEVKRLKLNLFRRRKPSSFYCKLMHSLQNYRLNRGNRVRDLMKELREEHLPLIKRRSIKNYSLASNAAANRFSPLPLKNLVLKVINTDDFRGRFMVTTVRQEEFSAPEEKHVCVDPSCETCEVIRSLMEPMVDEATPAYDAVLYTRNEDSGPLALAPCVELTTGATQIILTEGENCEILDESEIVVIQDVSEAIELSATEEPISLQTAVADEATHDIKQGNKANSEYDKVSSVGVIIKADAGESQKILEQELQQPSIETSPTTTSTDITAKQSEQPHQLAQKKSNAKEANSEEEVQLVLQIESPRATSVIRKHESNSTERDTEFEPKRRCNPIDDENKETSTDPLCRATAKTSPNRQLQPEVVVTTTVICKIQSKPNDQKEQVSEKVVESTTKISKIQKEEVILHSLEGKITSDNDHQITAQETAVIRKHETKPKESEDRPKEEDNFPPKENDNNSDSSESDSCSSSSCSTSESSDDDDDDDNAKEGEESQDSSDSDSDSDSDSNGNETLKTLIKVVEKCEKLSKATKSERCDKEAEEDASSIEGKKLPEISINHEDSRKEVQASNEDVTNPRDFVTKPTGNIIKYSNTPRKTSSQQCSKSSNQENSTALENIELSSSHVNEAEDPCGPPKSIEKICTEKNIDNNNRRSNVIPLSSTDSGPKAITVQNAHIEVTSDLPLPDDKHNTPSASPPKEKNHEQTQLKTELPSDAEATVQNLSTSVTNEQDYKSTESLEEVTDDSEKCSQAHSNSTSEKSLAKTSPQLINEHFENLQNLPSANEDKIQVQEVQLNTLKVQRHFGGITPAAEDSTSIKHTYAKTNSSPEHCSRNSSTNSSLKSPEVPTKSNVIDLSEEISSSENFKSDKTDNVKKSPHIVDITDETTSEEEESDSDSDSEQSMENIRKSPEKPISEQSSASEDSEISSSPATEEKHPKTSPKSKVTNMDNESIIIAEHVPEESLNSTSVIKSLEDLQRQKELQHGIKNQIISPPSCQESNQEISRNVARREDHFKEIFNLKSVIKNSISSKEEEPVTTLHEDKLKDTLEADNTSYQNNRNNEYSLEESREGPIETYLPCTPNPNSNPTSSMANDSKRKFETPNSQRYLSDNFEPKRRNKFSELWEESRTFEESESNAFFEPQNSQDRIFEQFREISPELSQHQMPLETFNEQIQTGPFKSHINPTNLPTHSQATIVEDFNDEVLDLSKDSKFSHHIEDERSNSRDYEDPSVAQTSVLTSPPRASVLGNLNESPPRPFKPFNQLSESPQPEETNTSRASSYQAEDNYFQTPIIEHTANDIDLMGEKITPLRELSSIDENTGEVPFKASTSPYLSSPSNESLNEDSHPATLKESDMSDSEAHESPETEMPTRHQLECSLTLNVAEPAMKPIDDEEDISPENSATAAIDLQQPLIWGSNSVMEQTPSGTADENIVPSLDSSLVHNLQQQGDTETLASNENEQRSSNALISPTPEFSQNNSKDSLNSPDTAISSDLETSRDGKKNNSPESPNNSSIINHAEVNVAVQNCDESLNEKVRITNRSPVANIIKDTVISIQHTKESLVSEPNLNTSTHHNAELQTSTSIALASKLTNEKDPQVLSSTNVDASSSTKESLIAEFSPSASKAIEIVPQSSDSEETVETFKAETEGAACSGNIFQNNTTERIDIEHLPTETVLTLADDCQINSSEKFGTQLATESFPTTLKAEEIFSVEDLPVEDKAELTVSPPSIDVCQATDDVVQKTKSCHQSEDLKNSHSKLEPQKETLSNEAATDFKENEFQKIDTNDAECHDSQPSIPVSETKESSLQLQTKVNTVETSAGQLMPEIEEKTPSELQTAETLANVSEHQNLRSSLSEADKKDEKSSSDAKNSELLSSNLDADNTHKSNAKDESCDSKSPSSPRSREASPEMNFWNTKGKYKALRTYQSDASKSPINNIRCNESRGSTPETTNPLCQNESEAKEAVKQDKHFSSLSDMDENLLSKQHDKTVPQIDDSNCPSLDKLNNSKLDDESSGFKMQTSFDDGSDFNGFEDQHEEERIRREIENLNDDSAANDAFLYATNAGSPLKTPSPSSKSSSELDELEALEKEISQHCLARNLKDSPKATSGDVANDLQTESTNMVSVSDVIISTNDIEHIKKMLESDEEPPNDEVTAVSNAKNLLLLKNHTEEVQRRETPAETNNSLSRVCIIPKLSDLCRAALNSSLNVRQITIVQNNDVEANNSSHNSPLGSTRSNSSPPAVERELSVEEALAEMYRQAGVLLSDPEDNENATSATLTCNSGTEADTTAATTATTTTTEEAQDVLLINLHEILNSNNDVYVLQCNMNVNNGDADETNANADAPSDANATSQANKTERVNTTTLQLIGILNRDSESSEIHIISSDSESEVIILSDCDTDVEFQPPPPPTSYMSPPTTAHREYIPFINDYEDTTSDSMSDLSTIHHEEIVPDNLNKFLQEEFYKYLHEKYAQKKLSKYYHANRILRKYKKSRITHKNRT